MERLWTYHRDITENKSGVRTVGIDLGAISVKVIIYIMKVGISFSVGN